MQFINSMTGFGRRELMDDEHRIMVEIKSVNHRYLDATLKMPSGEMRLVPAACGQSQ